MNYKKIYKSLYTKAKNRKTEIKNCERHHFIPRSLENTEYKQILADILGVNSTDINSPENVLPLTMREHYVAHMILFKIFPDVKQIMFALNIVLNRYNSSKKYEKFRLKVNKAIGDSNRHMVTCYNKLNGKYEKVSTEIFGTSEHLIGANCLAREKAEFFECQYCGKEYDIQNLGNHEKYYCKKNPSKTTQEHNKPIYECKYGCGMTTIKNNIAKHERTCKLNPNPEESRKHNMTESACKFCGKTGKKNAIKRHEKYDCEHNINKLNRKIADTVKCKYCNKEFSPNGIVKHEQACKNI